MRRLLSNRRPVPPERRERYRAAWERLAAAVAAQGGHAWVFRAANGEPLYMEFLEFGGETDPRTDTLVVGALAELDRIGERAGTDEWVEAFPKEPRPAEDDANG